MFQSLNSLNLGMVNRTDLWRYLPHVLHSLENVSLDHVSKKTKGNCELIGCLCVYECIRVCMCMCVCVFKGGSALEGPVVSVLTYCIIVCLQSDTINYC